MATGTVIDVVMPQMGVSVSEGTVSRWLKAEGDTIEKDETLLEISTDKVDTEVPSPASGIVTKIMAPEGETLDVGAVLAQITSGDGAEAGAVDVAPTQSEALAEEVASAPAAGAYESAAAAEPAQLELAPQAVAAPATNGSNGHSSASVPVAGAAPVTQTGGGFVSPVVARIASEHGIDVGGVAGSGSGGRVTKKDILAFVAGGGNAAVPSEPAASNAAPVATNGTVTLPASPGAIPQAAPIPASTSAASAAAAVGAPTPAPVSFSGGERVVPFSPMRKAIARHMTESVATSAHVTSTIEVDMTRVVRLRTQIKAELEASWGVRVTFTHFVVRALADAIAHWPLMNAEIRGESAVIKSYLNLGVAVALDDGAGLIVPVVHNIEEKNLVGIARSINDVAARARTKKLSPDDVRGGTFTLTNPGIYGAVHGTPIINQPQVGILDTEAIIKRPVVVTDAEGNDSIAIRSMMNLCLSYDHRLIDGAYAVQFLAHIKRNLQDWDLAAFTG